jgi:hypothetical protein
MNQLFPGDFSLIDVKLYPIVADGQSIKKDDFLDIKELVQEISISESVISVSLYCQIVIRDIGNNLIGKLPLMGQERVEIKILSKNIEYELNFYIYKIDGRSMKEKDQIYVMHLTSLEALHNESERIMERVNGIKSDLYLKQKFEKQGGVTPSFTTKKFNADATLYPFDMYVPNWRLFDTAIWMSRRSVSPEYKNSVGFLFYETFDGYNFKSIDKLINQTPYPNESVKYTYVQGNTSASKTEKTNYRILNYSSPKVFDLFDDLRNGAFCHNSVYVDINNAVCQIFKTNADQYWNNMSHLEGLKPYRTKTEEKITHFPTRLVYRPTTINTFGWKEVDVFKNASDYVDNINSNYEKSIYRYYFLEYNKLEISIPGDLELRAGNVIQISLPSPVRTSDESVVEDERSSGKYLVHSVRHSILNRTELRTTVTLSRDSFGGNKIADEKQLGGQVNLGTK